MADPTVPPATSEGATLTVGDRVGPLSVETLAHGHLPIPGPTLLLLQFRRFAGCPICNLHLRSFAQRIDEVRAHDVEPVAIFHSSAEDMAPYQGALPFPAIPDPERSLYRRFGVEKRSLAAVLHPKAMWAGMVGTFRTRSNPLGKGEHLGLPADFLLDQEGTVLHAQYGTHASDHLEVDALLSLLG